MRSLDRSVAVGANSADALLLALLGSRVDTSETTVIGLCGFPLTGKTTLAREWIASRPGAAHLPTEAAVASRSARRSAGFDGCDARAHDTMLLATLVASLRAGRSTEVPRYDWAVGAIVGSDTQAIGRGGLIVIDGSVACEPAIASVTDRLVFLLPGDPGWFQDAVDRDVAERFWEHGEARRQNRLKIATVLDQHKRVQDAIDVFLEFVPGRADRPCHQIIPPETAAERIAELTDLVELRVE